MAEYYLISQLPSLDGLSDNVPVPITEERFYDVCNRILGKKAQDELSKVSLVPPRIYENSGSNVMEAWNRGEQNLRLALGKARGEKLNKQFDSENRIFTAELMQTVRAAVEMDSPLEAEKTLNRYRMEYLETLRPMNTFSEEFVFYYCLKLKLILRMRQFDAESGKAAYKNIYDSIMSGEELEVRQ